ncbi:hypothetical protein BXU01_16515 [[Flexibacter] sp. ATCC 35103]|nr:hypothetical protein BXU01_16515 [[Flexibacter] sp. ATCC 35103]
MFYFVAADFNLLKINYKAKKKSFQINEKTFVGVAVPKPFGRTCDLPDFQSGRDNLSLIVSI